MPTKRSDVHETGGTPPSNTVRLAYCTVPPDQIETGIERLAAAV
jgi:DNA-binding transcriptional MocR family regulator